MTEWISQQPVHFRSVFAFEIDFLGLSNLQLSQERAVLMSQLTQRIAFHRVNFRRFRVVAGKQNRVSAGSIQARDHDRRVQKTTPRAVKSSYGRSREEN